MVVYRPRGKRKGGPGTNGRPIDLDCRPLADKFENGETIELSPVAQAAGRNDDTGGLASPAIAGGSGAGSSTSRQGSGVSSTGFSDSDNESAASGGEGDGAESRRSVMKDMAAQTNPTCHTASQTSPIGAATGGVSGAASQGGIGRASTAAGAAGCTRAATNGAAFAAAVPSSPGSMLEMLEMLPAALQDTSKELLSELDEAQRLAVSGAAHGLNMAIVGPPGHGKSHCMGKAIGARLSMSDAGQQAVVGVGPTHTARRVMQLQVERQGLAQSVHVHTLAAGMGVRMGEAYLAASIVSRVRGENRVKALTTYHAETVWIDEAGQVDPANADGISESACQLRGQPGKAQGGQQVLLSLDVAQNLPVSVNVQRGDASVPRLIFESEMFLRGDFWIVLLQTPYRNTDPRMLRVLEDLTCDCCSKELVDFFWAAAKVRFPEDPQGRLALEDRVRHFVQSNKLRDSIGKTTYLLAGPPGEVFEYKPPATREGVDVAELTKPERLLIEKKFASRYTVGPLILRQRDSYFFTGGTEEEVKVGEMVLTSGEELKLLSWHVLASGRVLLTMEALEQGGQMVTLDPVILKAQGAAGQRNEIVEVSVMVLPVIYGRVMTSFKSQGREYKFIHVHAAGLQGEDNQLLTMISRGKGSPWAGSVKVDGITLSSGGKEQFDLKRKMKPYIKSLLIAKLLGKPVDENKYHEARAAVLQVDPNWERVEKAISQRVLTA